MRPVPRGPQDERGRDPGLDAAGASLSFVADVSLPVDITAPIRFEHLFPGGAAATMRAAPPLASYARVSQRQRSLLVAPHRERVDLTWRLPAEASLADVRQRASVDEGVVRWVRTMESRVARVSPTAWPMVRAQLAPLMTASDARVVFVVARSQIGVLFPVEAGTKFSSAGGARAPAG